MEIERKNDQLGNVLKSYYFHYTLILVFVLLVHSFIYYFEGNIIIFRFLLSTSAFFSIVTLATYQLEYNILKYLVNYYVIMQTALVAVLVFVFWKNSPEHIIYFALLPLGIYNIYNLKKIVIYTVIICSLLICMASLPISYFPNIPNKHNIHLSSIKVAITFLSFALFLIFYNIKISQVKFNILMENSVKNIYDFIELNSEIDKESEQEDISNIEMYNSLFQRVIKHFDSDSPWRDADYSIQDLAYKFGTNSTYLSKAINHNTDNNFKTLINTYRINYIKDEMRINYPKYTLMYIYTNAGFRHQSTFNRAFKQIENKTPSEFISSLGYEDHSL